ncbi:MAG: hypothetical protein IJT70_03850 [Clostridia bacterium]|nr:hypothetical protein [Clostridia bacterium]
MKTLNTIQKLSKLGKILSKIIFVFCLVGGILCVVGIIGLALIPDGIKLGGVTIRGLIEKNADISVGTCYAAMAVGIVFCAGEAVLCKFAERYFKNELKAGTPFTFDGAKELMRLGILTICIPVGTTIIAEIVYQIMKHSFSDVVGFDLGGSISVGLGIMFIVTSLICRHGAEISQGKTGEE